MKRAIASKRSRTVWVQAVKMNCALVACASLLSCGASIQNPQRSLPAGTTTTVEQVGEAIHVAARQQHWIVNDVGPGEMKALFSRGPHIAVVLIHHDETSFRIQYLDSENLDHRGGKIHPTYNRWVLQFAESILANAQRP